MSGKKLIHDGTTELPIFTGQAGGQSVGARYENGAPWLSQNRLAAPTLLS